MNIIKLPYNKLATQSIIDAAKMLTEKHDHSSILSKIHLALLLQLYMVVEICTITGFVSYVKFEHDTSEPSTILIRGGIEGVAYGIHRKYVQGNGLIEGWITANDIRADKPLMFRSHKLLEKSDESNDIIEYNRTCEPRDLIRYSFNTTDGTFSLISDDEIHEMTLLSLVKNIE